MLSQWIPLLLIGAAIALWLRALRAREQAGRLARELCHRAGVQLLDQTVSLRRVGLARVDGRLRLKRRYGFEVSTHGHDRHPGHLDLLGDALRTWSIPVAQTSPVLQAPLPAQRPSVTIEATGEVDRSLEARRLTAEAQRQQQRGHRESGDQADPHAASPVSGVKGQPPADRHADAPIG
jgi:hypothetical protein